MLTRNQYLNQECSHEDYYGQFVTADIIQMVIGQFGLSSLQTALAQDRHLNSIPLREWDNLAMILRMDDELQHKMQAAKDNISLAGLVCIVKEAARQAVMKAN